MIKIKSGLDLPISGAPAPFIDTARPVRSVALMGCDYHGMKPTMAVQVGDRVKLGQLLFSDKKNPGVLFTAPGAGRVSAIHRGEQRLLQSVVIDLEGDEEVTFASYPVEQLERLEAQAVRDNLQQSGLWTALRSRPFSKVPAVDATPSSIFVTALDTQPLAADPLPIIQAQAADFESGLKVLARLAKLFRARRRVSACPASNWPACRSKASAGRILPDCRVPTSISSIRPVPARASCTWVFRTASPSAR